MAFRAQGGARAPSSYAASSSPRLTTGGGSPSLTVNAPPVVPVSPAHVSTWGGSPAPPASVLKLQPVPPGTITMGPPSQQLQPSYVPPPAPAVDPTLLDPSQFMDSGGAYFPMPDDGGDDDMYDDGQNGWGSLPDDLPDDLDSDADDMADFGDQLAGDVLNYRPRWHPLRAAQTAYQSGVRSTPMRLDDRRRR